MERTGLELVASYYLGVSRGCSYSRIAKFGQEYKWPCGRCVVGKARETHQNFPGNPIDF